MSEDRTAAPSRRRRQLARERGIVARSPELTRAAALLAGVLMLGAWGDELGAGLTAGFRGASNIEVAAMADPLAVASMIRGAVLNVLAPLAFSLGAMALAAWAAHQAQVGGLFLPAMLAPDPSRLARANAEVDLGMESMRGAWALAKSIAVVAVLAVLLRSRWDEFGRLGTLEPDDLAMAVVGMLRSLLLSLALAMVALGAADFGFQHRRIEAMLRSTPEEHREDEKAVEGDPALRSRRRKLAQSRRFDPSEAVIGASVLLAGDSGLTLVLGGGPPGRRPVLVRAMARGGDGVRLRRAAEQAGLPRLDSPALARHLARGVVAPIPPDLADDLAGIWPERA